MWVGHGRYRLLRKGGWAADTHIQMAGWENRMRVLCKEERSGEPDKIMGGKGQTPSSIYSTCVVRV